MKLREIFVTTAVVSSLALSLSANCLALMPPTDKVATASPASIPSLSPMLAKIMPAVVNITVVGELPISSAYAYLYGDNDTNSNNDSGDDEDNNDNNQSPSADNNQQSPGPNFPKNPKFQDMGSGVIVNAANGYIVTNAHLTTHAKIITVTLSDGRRFIAHLIGVDRLSDIAVLKINAKNLTQMPIGDSDNLKVGDFVAAIGNPFGLNQTVTSGMISALHRSDLGIEGYENFIQTDTPINPGNSGGALVNLKGELIGINTALIGPISGNVGIGFAIPSNMMRSVIDELVKYGKIKRGVLGVMVQDFTPALADAMNLSGTQGALVTNVTPNSPAARAGLQATDIVVKINNTAIMNAAQLRNMIGLMPIGTNVAMEIRREKKSFTLNATIIDPKNLKMSAQPVLASFLDGVRLTSYDELVPDLGPIRGVGVINVDQTSVAWVDGLRAGDIIVEANNQPVTNITQLMQAVNSNADRLLLKVSREGGVIFLVINL
jgi:Do/DeqQ family serine protease